MELVFACLYLCFVRRIGKQFLQLATFTMMSFARFSHLWLFSVYSTSNRVLSFSSILAIIMLQTSCSFMSSSPGGTLYFFHVSHQTKVYFKEIGSKYSGKIVDIHAILHMVLGYFCQELAQVLEEAIVGIWQLFY